MHSFGDYTFKEKLKKITQICVGAFCLLFLLFIVHAVDQTSVFHLFTFFAWPNEPWLIIVIFGSIVCSSLLICVIVIINTKRALRKSWIMIQAHFSDKLKHYEWLFEETGQCLFIWDNPTALPRIIGNIPTLQKAGIHKKDFQHFKKWLEKSSLQQLDQALTQLRCNG
ncbi:MAG: hypothetical protein PV353_05395 [Bartonella sp.]|nr:hypothetical protein [Bartonella sp.]